MTNNTNGSEETLRLSLRQVLFSFRGRIRRSTYWKSTFSILAVMFLSFYVIGLMDENEPMFGVSIALIYILIVWVSFAVQVKRWHDRNKSGWFVLVIGIPIIGPLWALIENGFLSGRDDVNRFGPPEEK